MCVDLFRSRPWIVAQRLADALLQKRRLALSVITLHELWVGVSDRRPGDEPKLRVLLQQADLIDWPPTTPSPRGVSAPS